MIEIGYTVNLKKVYMQEYAVPQRRKRVIIVGNREGKDFNFPNPIEYASGCIYKNSSFTLQEAIKDLEMCDIPEIDHIRKKEDGIQLERMMALKQGQSMKDLPEYLQHESLSEDHREECVMGCHQKKEVEHLLG